MNSESKEALFAGLLWGLILGIAVAVIACESSHRRELSSVGIDHIEHCHNVHSNWYEIVWANESEVKK